MKDNRFIELVNLYIDRQISGEEMEALEAEMQSSPRRRAVYRQYCQMHRATSLVYESFRTENAGQAVKTATADAGIANFEPRQVRRTPWAYYATGIAAAACAALVLVRVNTYRMPTENLTAAALKSKPASVVAMAPAPVVIVPVETVATPAVPVNIRPKSLMVEQDYAAMLAAMRREEQRAFASGQIQPSRTTSLFEDGVFDSQPAGSARTFQTKSTTAKQPEMAAFQFQRN